MEDRQGFLFHREQDDWWIMIRSGRLCCRSWRNGKTERIAATGVIETESQLGIVSADEMLNLDDEALGGILQSLEAFKG